MTIGLNKMVVSDHSDRAKHLLGTPLLGGISSRLIQGANFLPCRVGPNLRRPKWR